MKEGRRGDILYVYLLSLATGVHTVVHLKHNKLWCTLKEIPKMHQELIKRCDKHLAYLGFGIFLRLNERPPPLNIIGTVSGCDPETQQLLLASVHKQIKPEFTGTTSASIDTSSTTSNIHLSTFKKASAAAGSESQLKRLESKMKSDLEISCQPRKQPMVNLLSFQLKIQKLTAQDIRKYTLTSKHHSDTQAKSVRLSLPSPKSNPIKTRLMTRRTTSTSHKQ